MNTKRILIAENEFSNYLIKERSAVNRYGVSLVILLAAFTVISLFSEFEIIRLFSLTLTAIVFAAIHGGVGPSILTSLMGAFMVNFVFAADRADRILDVFLSAEYWIRTASYLVTALIVSFVICELKKFYKSSARAKVLAEIANAEKDSLIRVIAHDLKNPLGIIMGYAELLKLKNHPQEKIQYISKKIAKTSRDLATTIDDLLTYSTTTGRKAERELKPVRVDKVLRTVFKSQLLRAHKKGIALNLKIPPYRVVINGDVLRIARVFQNLLDNAIKYSSEGQSVRVEVSLLPEAVRIKFVDHGPGIHPDDIAKLFKPMGRTRNRPTSNEISTGLGLSICKEIVEEHGGVIQLQNLFPHGSVFWVSFPVVSVTRKERKKLRDALRGKQDAVAMQFYA